MAEIEATKRLVGHELTAGSRAVRCLKPAKRTLTTRLCSAGSNATKTHRETPLLRLCCWRVALHFYRSYLSCDFASPIDQSQKDVSCGMLIVGKVL